MQRDKTVMRISVDRKIGLCGGLKNEKTDNSRLDHRMFFKVFF